MPAPPTLASSVPVVVGNRAREKVCRIAATPVIAAMANHHPVRDRSTMCQLPTDAMCAVVFARAIDIAVAIGGSTYEGPALASSTDCNLAAKLGDRYRAFPARPLDPLILGMLLHRDLHRPRWALATFCTSCNSTSTVILHYVQFLCPGLSLGNFLDMLETTEHKENMPYATRRKLVTVMQPGCEAGCRVCYLECAVKPARLAWWEREVERLLRERVAFADPDWQHWRDHLQAAQAACEELQQQIEATRSLAGHPAALAAHLGEPQSAFLH